MLKVLTKWSVINSIPPYGKLSTSEKKVRKLCHRWMDCSIIEVKSSQKKRSTQTLGKIILILKYVLHYLFLHDCASVFYSNAYKYNSD